LQELDRDFAAQLQVARCEHAAHAAVADLPFYRVPVDHRCQRVGGWAAGLRRDGWLAADLVGVGIRPAHRRRIPPGRGVDKRTDGPA